MFSTQIKEDGVKLGAHVGVGKTIPDLLVPVELFCFFSNGFLTNRASIAKNDFRWGILSALNK